MITGLIGRIRILEADPDRTLIKRYIGLIAVLAWVDGLCVFLERVDETRAFSSIINVSISPAARNSMEDNQWIFTSGYF